MTTTSFNTTVSPNTAAPDEFVQKLDGLEPLVPEFTQLTPEERQAIGRLAGIDPAFVQDAIGAIGVSDPLRNSLGRSAEELQQEAELTARWGVATDRVESMLKGMKAGLMIRRHRLGLIALQAYQVARALARQKENANLLPHLEKLAAHNKRGKRREASVPVASPVPVPPVKA